MSREGTKADVRPDLKLHARLDEIAEQTRIVAAALQERVIAFTKGEISLEALEGIRQAASLKGAIMPNGQKYEDWLKSKGP